MIYVEPSVELYDEKDNFKRIERCGRISYKSEDKMTENSAEPFFWKIVKLGHTSVLEHSVIFVRTHAPETYMWMKYILSDYIEATGYQHYIRCSKFDKDDTIYRPSLEGTDLPIGFCVGKEYLFSGNIRAWRNICTKFRGEALLHDTFFEHPAFKDIFEDYDDHEVEYTHEQIEIVDSIPFAPEVFEDSYKHNIVTLHITTDRGIIDEYCRHRSISPTVESSRYVNYADKGVTFVFPWWFEKLDDPEKGKLYTSMAADFGARCYEVENSYLEWMSHYKSQQIARGNLCLWLKSEGAFTGTVQNWIDLIALRDSPHAHPDAQKVAKMIEKVLVEQVGVKDLWGVKGNGVDARQD